MHRIRSIMILCIGILSNSTEAQVRDTVIRDIGINVSWRSVAFNYPETAKAADIMRNLVFGVEVRAWRFWIQTGAIIGWNRYRPLKDEYSFNLYVAMPYEFGIFRKRVFLGVGPIANYYHHISKGAEWNGGEAIVRSDLFSLGVDLEITVPIWEGISLETSSDIGVAVGFKNGQAGFTLQVIRVLSIGINYRFKAYPK